MKYKAELVNESGCTFDKGFFATIKAAKEWAKGRGGKNKLKLFETISGEKHLTKELIVK
jgi:hypothetical protein